MDKRGTPKKTPLWLTVVKFIMAIIAVFTWSEAVRMAFSSAGSDAAISLSTWVFWIVAVIYAVLWDKIGWIISLTVVGLLGYIGLNLLVFLSTIQ